MKVFYDITVKCNAVKKVHDFTIQWHSRYANVDLLQLKFDQNSTVRM